MTSETTAAPAAVSRETQEAARRGVRELLERSQAFSALDEGKRRDLANGLVQIATQLIAPGGVRVPPSRMSAPVRALAESGVRRTAVGSNTDEEGRFTAQGAREGAAVAGALLEAVNFPAFVSGLIDGVFHSIVTSSIQQMEAYAKLVADVSKSLNEFRDENTTPNQGRDQLVEQFPDLFQLTLDGGEFGGGFGAGFGEPASLGVPQVVLREGIDERAAIQRINQSLPLDVPITRLDDELVEAVLVPAARTQIASSRQQLLATMVMLGINRIVVTDGKIQAKVMYDFQARDNMQFKRSAQQFDYGGPTIVTESVGEGGEIRRSGPVRNLIRMPNGRVQEQRRDGSFYAKGDYKSISQPALTLSSASQTTTDASLQTKASLAGLVEVNFKSDHVPLDKLANPESIAAIQMNAQPGMVKTLAVRPPRPAAAPAPAATPTTPAA